MQPHLAIFHVDSVPDATFAEFQTTLANEQINVIVVSREPNGPFAGLEWLMTTFVVGFVAAMALKAKNSNYCCADQFQSKTTTNQSIHSSIFLRDINDRELLARCLEISKQIGKTMLVVFGEKIGKISPMNIRTGQITDLLITLSAHCLSVEGLMGEKCAE